MPTVAGFLLLAVVLDAWSRKMVGWAFSSDLKTRVVLDVFGQVLCRNRPNVLAVRGSDQASGR